MVVEINHACIVITDIINGEYIKRRYIGYNKAEAKRRFRAELSTRETF
jgi:hypothetical protein